MIQGNLEVARAALGDAADRVETEFRLIDDQVYRISVIVSRLLQFARPEDYSGAANVISPSEVVRDCLVLTRPHVEAAGIRTDLQDDARADVRMARTELQQVIVNLILNAVHAMPDGGTLTLRLEDVTDAGRAAIALTVTDTGTGIPAEVLPRIFDPFFTTKQAQGTGLGLSISQQLVSRMGGRIEVRSTPGTGTAFRILLPAAGNP